MNHLILGDGLGDGRLNRSVINPQQAPQQVLDVRLGDS
jgi:hypothetical protein